MKQIKKQVLTASAAALALGMSASSMAAFQLVANGDLGTGDGSNFAFEGGGGSIFDATAGYIEIDNTSAVWGGVVVANDDPLGIELSTFGLSGGDTIDVQFDMRCESGPCANGGVKVESWDEVGPGALDFSADNFFAVGSAWQTFSFSYNLNAAATRTKIVLLGIDNTSVYQFDNIGVANAVTSPVPVPAAAWLFGSALLGLGAARRNK